MDAPSKEGKLPPQSLCNPMYGDMPKKKGGGIFQLSESHNLKEISHPTKGFDSLEETNKLTCTPLP